MGMWCDTWIIEINFMTKWLDLVVGKVPGCAHFFWVLISVKMPIKRLSFHKVYWRNPSRKQRNREAAGIFSTTKDLKGQEED